MSARPCSSCDGSGVYPNEVPGVGTEWVGCPGCDWCGQSNGGHAAGCRLGLNSDEALEIARKAAIAEARAEGSEAAIERARDVLDGWEHDGPDDPATHLLIQRVREALDGVAK